MYLPWTAIYFKKKPRTRFTTSPLYYRIKKTYPRTDDKTAYMSNFKTTLSTTEVQTWINTIKTNLIWAVNAHYANLLILKSFRGFQELCYQNRKAISILYGLNYNQPQLNKFFTITKNYPKVSIHYALINTLVYVNKYRIFTLFKGIDQDLLQDKLRINYTKAQFSNSPAQTYDYAHLPLSQKTLLSVLFKKATRTKLAKKHIWQKQSMLHNSSSPQLNFGSQLNFGHDHYASLSTVSKLELEQFLVRNWRVPTISLIQTISDFRVLYLKTLLKSTKLKIPISRTPNLNFFTYRTNNWKIIV